MSKKLKSLAEHDAEARRRHGNPWIDDELRLNGIACPDCEAELIDIHPETLLTSYPPQADIYCRKCGYTGYRIA